MGWTSPQSYIDRCYMGQLEFNHQRPSSMFKRARSDSSAEPLARPAKIQRSISVLKDDSDASSAVMPNNIFARAQRKRELSRLRRRRVKERQYQLQEEYAQRNVDNEVLIGQMKSTIAEQQADLAAWKKNYEQLKLQQSSNQECVSIEEQSNNHNEEASFKQISVASVDHIGVNSENIPSTNCIMQAVTTSSKETQKPPSNFNKLLTPQELCDKFSEARMNTKTHVQTIFNALKTTKGQLELIRKEFFKSKLQVTRLEQDLVASESKLNMTIDECKEERHKFNSKIVSDLELIKTQFATQSHRAENQIQSVLDLQIQNHKLQDRIQDLEQENQELKTAVRADEIKMKQLHNEVQELKGNIRVFCRVRPCSDGSAPTALSFPKKDMIEIMGRSDVSLDGSSTSRRTHSFQFDRVFSPSATQDDVWQEISQLCTSAIDGYKVAIFTYGQTGSGKTFTMEGPPHCSDPALQGMISRAIDQIFSCFNSRAERGWSFTCTISYVEICNEQIFDLLITEQPCQQNLKIKHGRDGSTKIVGVVMQQVHSSTDLIPLLLRASENRSTAATEQNERSSRSHSVFQLTIQGHNEVSGQDTVGVINLIDLAGSERLSRSESTGQTLKESQHINKSLSGLGDVIGALSNRSKHIPYRNSKLTYLLQKCFGGDSKCLMLVTISPEEENIPESLCSLRFASKVNSCHIGTAKRTIKQQ